MLKDVVRQAKLKAAVSGRRRLNQRANRKVEALGLRRSVARGPRLPVPSGWDMLPDEVRTQILQERTKLMRRDRYTPLGAFRPTRAEESSILPLTEQELEYGYLPRKFFLTMGQVRAIRRGELELTVVPPPNYDMSYVLTHEDEIVQGGGPLELYFYWSRISLGVPGEDQDVAFTGSGYDYWVVMTPELIEYVTLTRKSHTRAAAQYIQAAQRRRKYRFS